MRIGALQKTTLLDFPGKVSAVVFTQGCNFSCPYCHNPALVLCRDTPLARDDVLSFLTQRRHLLQGVVITGGEPTLQEDLEDFCVVLKDLGYAIKLDTNGSRPDALSKLLRLNLLDYVAMDVKAAPRRYPPEIFPGGSSGAVAESMALLRASAVAHELRVPCAAPFITEESFQDILEETDGKTQIFLHALRPQRMLAPDFFSAQGRALRREEMERLRARAQDHGCGCEIRQSSAG